MSTAAEGKQIKSNQPQTKKTVNIHFNKNPIMGIYVYIIRENFVEEKWWIFLKISPLFPDKVILDKVFIFAVGVQVGFCGDKILWICWKPSSPRKLIHAKINLAKVYLLEVKRIHNKETATCRSSTKICFAKSCSVQYSFEKEMNQFCNLHLCL